MTMENEELMKKEELKKQFKDEINKIIALDNESYNIFSILGYNRKELKHSRFMRWLLSFDAFFERFTKACGINGIEVNSKKAKRKINLEETYDPNTLIDKNIPISRGFYEENEKYRHIDINIIGGEKDNKEDKKNYSITIENKVDTGEHNDQCISYYNYMKDKDGEYKNINNKFFIFLAKEVPHDFSYCGGLITKGKKCDDLDDREYSEDTYNKVYEETDGKRKMRFFNYRLITYKDILGILKNIDIHNEVGNENWDFVQMLLAQFVRTIKEWDELGEGYIKIINEIIDDEGRKRYFYYAVKNLKKLKEGEDESDFGRFLEVISDYCSEVKRKTDKNIKPALEAIISDNITLKTDYDRSDYANSIPIAIRYAGSYDKLRFICNKKILDKDKKHELTDSYYYALRIKPEQKKAEAVKDFDNKLKKYLKEMEKSEQKNFGLQPNNNNLMLQTVDFRAPMGGSQFITVGIYAGLSKNFSDNLCDYVLTAGFKKINDYVKAHTKNVKFTWTYKVKDESGYNDESHKICEVNVDFDVFHKFFSSNPELAKSFNGLKAKNNKRSKKSEKIDEFIPRILDNKNIFEEGEAEILIDKINSYINNNHNAVTCLWTMGITFELEGFPDKNGNINEKALAKEFYDTTLEAMELFGYADYFKNYIFKSGAELDKAIENLNNEK